jgi:hypothetical protein
MEDFKNKIEETRSDPAESKQGCMKVSEDKRAD